MLAELAISEPQAFRAVAEKAKSALSALARASG
jgi:ribosomal protein L20